MEESEKEVILTLHAQAYGAAMAHRLFLHTLVRALAFQGALDLSYFVELLENLEHHAPAVGTSPLAGVASADVGKAILEELEDMLQGVEMLQSEGFGE